MANTPRIYALLAANSDYRQLREEDLPGCREDLALMRRALEKGLRVDPDNIRSLGEDGKVGRQSFARAIAEFGSLLVPEDTFIFYFSGHGRPNELLFADGAVTIESIVTFIERLPARSRIVILDCCYSGGTNTTSMKMPAFEESLAAFAGRGIAVMASSAADRASWTGETGACSLYTQMAAAAILSRRTIREGKRSLSDISEEIRFLMTAWNREHPDRQQHPIYRDSMAGTIYFEADEHHPYVPRRITFDTDLYTLRSVKPLSTGNLKRMAAFVVMKTPDDLRLPEITREIAGIIKDCDVYADRRSEERFKGRTADAIWCYFGRDEEDLARSNYFAYTIWAEREEMRGLYFRENRNSEVADGIYIFWNTGYGLSKKLSQTATPDEEILASTRELENLLISKAEEYRAAVNEAENGVISYERLNDDFRGWIGEVRNLFFRLTNLPPAPVSSVKWADLVLDLAGWVVDIAILLESRGGEDDEGGRWLRRQALRRYERSLAALSETEKMRRHATFFA